MKVDNWFINDLFTKGYAMVLDKYFVEDTEKYEEELEGIKRQGFRVYRNGDGKHKVEAISDYMR